MTITDMDIEYNPACDADVLIVGEGRDNDVIHRYCSREKRYGNETEEEMLKERFKVGVAIQFSQSIMWLQYACNDGCRAFTKLAEGLRLNFTSDESTTAAGFRAEWNAECGAVFRLSHGVISSPNYPNYYPNQNAQCEYLIAPEGEAAKSVIALKLLDFDLSDSKMDYSRYPCPSDYLEIRDVNNNRVVVTYCGGDAMSEEAIAIKGAVGITFVTNQSYIQGAKKIERGFQISYSIERCGGDIEMTEESGYMTTISSPAFPLDYAHDLDCLWNVTAPEGRVLAIKYEFMDLEHSNDCVMDYLELVDGVDLNGTSFGKVCGGKAQMPAGRLYTKSNNLIVNFVTDRTMNSGGFKLVVIATLGEKAGCGGTLKATGEWQTLKPPLDKNADGDCSEAFIEIRDVGLISKCQHPACAKESSDRKVHAGATMLKIASKVPRKPIYEVVKMATHTFRICGNTPFPPFISNTMAVQIKDQLNNVDHPAAVRVGMLALPHIPILNQLSRAVEEPGQARSLKSANGPLALVSPSYMGGSIDFSTSYDSQGAITNIGYPKGYNASTKTSWKVMPPNGHACTLEVTILDLAKDVPGLDCLSQDEYLEIEQSSGNPSDPRNGRDSVRLRSCAQSAPIALEMEPGADRYVRITFKTDDRTDNDGTGFRLSWECANYEVPQV
ncbi:CUB domain protein [Teladorsagia circumcincta]|uniref:CUB domain protein n=1 Tax=Teladorsagia circumcincta TaxID=45464 RepID=A0A2G9V4K4_TELCI|nr:CUB domain protein [Teladorsagia circumcincta]